MSASSSVNITSTLICLVVTGIYPLRLLLHGQHHAKARLSSHHFGVGIRRSLKRDRLDHGGHAAQRTETERCVTSRGIPCQGTFELPAPEDEIHARDLVR